MIGAQTLTKRGKHERFRRHRSEWHREKSEAELVRENRTPAYEARKRVYGLPQSLAERLESSTAIGRLRLAGNLSARQLEAAERYEAVRRECGVVMLTKQLRSGSEFNGPIGFDAREGTEPEYIEHYNAVMEIGRASRRALLEAHPFAYFAVETWVIDNVPIWELEGELRLGLNALAHLYRVSE